jgi:hypothetical protein
LISLPGDGHSLWDISRVDKRFHRLTEARLYERCYYTGKNSALFLRTLSSSQGLASHVRSITWESALPGMRSQDNVLSIVETSYVATRLRHLQRVAANRLADRFEHISITDNDAYLSTILLLTPRIEELTIKYTDIWSQTHTWLILATAHPIQLGHLKKVTICWMANVGNLQALLTLPSLRTIEVFKKEYAPVPLS